MVRENGDRVKTALQNGGSPFPIDRIAVNPAPAHLGKEKLRFDLSIAVGTPAATGIVNPLAADAGQHGKNGESGRAQTPCVAEMSRRAS